MTFIVTGLYPNTPETTFDRTYYIQKHLPLMDRAWKKHGLLEWKFVEYGPGPDGSASQFKAGVTLTFEDPESFHAAAASAEGKEVLNDVPNFSNAHPTFISGPLVASG